MNTTTPPPITWRGMARQSYYKGRMQPIRQELPEIPEIPEIPELPEIPQFEKATMAEYVAELTNN